MNAIASLEEVEFKVSSQFGDDGIIDWLVERAAIPPHLHSFVEFGVETYQEANTRFLLQNRNWKGLVLDASQTLARDLQKQGLYWRYDITATSSFITPENINDLLVNSGFSGDIGLLSIDIDGNDYWVWNAISAVRPVICICEYNAVFGDLCPLSIPYQPDFVRTLPEFGNLYFGCSIAALCDLGIRKGYRFMGTNSAGNNAFFVREDYATRMAGAVLNPCSLPSRVRESRDELGRPSHLGGLERQRVIADLPVVNTQTGETLALGSVGPLYSEAWLQRMS